MTSEAAVDNQIVCIHKSCVVFVVTAILSPALLHLLSPRPPNCTSNYAYLRPTKMVRDMRGKSRGLVDVCIGCRPKSAVLAGEAFAAYGAHRHELFQGGIHALAGYAVVAGVGRGGGSGK
jgi:hypothetical protein